MARGAGELLDERAALFRLETQCLVNGSLANEEEAVLSEARTVEQLVEIAQANLLAIEQVLLAAAAIGATGDLNLGEWQIKEPIVISDGERYLGEAERAALLLSGKDDLFHALRTNAATGLAERPAQSIDNV